MKPDALRLQLQTVLITYYEDIKGVVSASGCTSPRSSSASKWTKMLPTPPPPSQPMPTPPTPTPTQMPPPPPPRRTGARRRGTSTCPQLWGQERGRQRAGFQKRCWQGLRLIPIKLVCLNLIRHDTGQQPVPAYRPANQANKKAAASCTYQVQQCTYPVQQCLYIS
jgi:hypothetical protein